ncbi:MAG TPA: nitrilase-related carbon-nitrogen hydrolase [Gemmatimonadaceae bacterium]|nr:nitrilase-related carbon-nitrogen hydrolase [Gemmatimonadaceae bacterium]
MAERAEPTRDVSPRGVATNSRMAFLRSAWVFVAAAALLPFANGVNSIALAAFLAPLLLLRFTRAQRPVAGLLATFVLQSVAFAIQFRGMIPVPGVVLAPIVMFYAGALTVPYVADRLIAPRLGGWRSTLVFPCAWASVDYLVSFIPYGSWGSAAYALYGNLPLLQLLAVTGLWGVTFLIGWFAAAGNRVWELAERPAAALRACAVSFGVVALVAFAGSIRLAFFPPLAPTVRVASLSRMDLKLHPDSAVGARFFSQQPLAPEEIDTIRSRATVISDDLLARAEREARSGARVVFWGEVNAPVLAEDEPELIRRAGEVARRSGVYLGMSLAEWHMKSKPPLGNKLVLISPDGTVAWEYFKAHPVPSGEAAMSITRDGKLRSLDTPFGRLTSVICFDADFPRLLAQAGDLRADIVLDPSNDWKAIDPWHTQMASFRAIEQGVNLVRHASLGLSAAFDYQGHVLASMDHYLATDRVMVSQVPTRGVRTLYSILGDWFAWASLAAVAALAALARRHQP